VAKTSILLEHDTVSLGNWFSTFWDGYTSSRNVGSQLPSDVV